MELEEVAGLAILRWLVACRGLSVVLSGLKAWRESTPNSRTEPMNPTVPQCCGEHRNRKRKILYISVYVPKSKRFFETQRSSMAVQILISDKVKIFLKMLENSK